MLLLHNKSVYTVSPSVQSAMSLCNGEIVNEVEFYRDGSCAVMLLYGSRYECVGTDEQWVSYRRERDTGKEVCTPVEDEELCSNLSTIYAALFNHAHTVDVEAS